MEGMKEICSKQRIVYGVVTVACKDYKYSKPIDDSNRNRFGHEVPADMPAEQCPAKAFEPRRSGEIIW